LRIKTFIGASENAVRIQVWTALIAMLPLRYLHLRSTWRWTLLRQQIFVYRDLWKWLNQPDRPLQEADDDQLSFAWQAERPDFLDSSQGCGENNQEKESQPQQHDLNVLDIRPTT